MPTDADRQTAAQGSASGPARGPICGPVCSLDEAPGFVLAQTHFLFKARFKRELERAGLSITPEQLAVLGRLHEREGQTQRELADSTFKDFGSMTRMIDLMERKGLVERRPHPADRRAYALYLTQAGLGLKPAITRAVEAMYSDMWGGVDPKDIQRFLTMLRHLQTRAQADLHPSE